MATVSGPGRRSAETKREGPLATQVGKQKSLEVEPPLGSQGIQSVIEQGTTLSTLGSLSGKKLEVLEESRLREEVQF